jgi:regulator of cell morphogenesis and NO signaling
MQIDETMTVADVAGKHPHTTRVFEQLGIDYCCGGKKSLQEACRTANIPLQKALDLLQQAPSTAVVKDWERASLAELADHIVANHHGYVKQEIPRIQRLSDKVCDVHGGRHPELKQMRSVFQAMAQELALHMMKEEQVLFPYIAALESAFQNGKRAPQAPFGPVENPIRMMRMEHDSAGSALAELKSLSSGYTAPADGCTTYRTLFQALQEFEADLHQHIHLENNILFPRAEELENKVRE